MHLSYNIMEIKPSNNGFGLFATKSYTKGEIVFTLSGEIIDAPTRETIHIGNNKHIYDNYGIFINHSFAPSVWIDKLYVRAMLDITNGDQITFDYNVNEVNMAAPFYVDDILICGNK